MRYPVAMPDLSGNEEKYVSQCLKSTWISSVGQYIEQFEQAVAEFTQTKHAVAVCNGTVALHLALTGLGLQPGDEVIVPSLTFIATANAVKYCGATPVFADCDPDTWCLSMDSVERLITPRTKGIIPVHLYGNACDLDRLMQIARGRRLWVVEDCAEAMGALYRGAPVGSFGDAATFSFFGNKIVTTGEGGMVTTNNAVLAQSMRLLRGQGMDPGRRYWHIVVGFNYRMTNIAAAIGVAQMERAEELVGRRRSIAALYDQHLCNTPAVTCPIEAPDARSAYWMYSILLAKPEMRDAVIPALGQRGIETRPFFYPIHTMPMYLDAPSDRGCPVSCDVSARGLSLPSSSYLTPPDILTISAALREATHVSRTSRLAA